MSYKRKLMAAVALLAMSAATAAQAETIGFSVPSLTSSFWVSATYGVQKAAKEAGVELVVVDAGGDANAVQQISQIQDLVQRGVDAIHRRSAHKAEGDDPAHDSGLCPLASRPLSRGRDAASIFEVTKRNGSAIGTLMNISARAFFFGWYFSYSSPAAKAGARAN